MPGRFTSTMKIRTRFLFALILVSIVPLVAASAICLMIARGAIQDQILKELQSIVVIQKKRVEAKLEQSRDRLAQAKSRTLLVESLARYPDDPSSAAALEKNLSDALAALPSFKRISVLDMNGRVIASTDPALVGRDESGEEVFLESRSADNVSVFFRGDDGELMQYLAGPVVADGRTLGVLVIESDAGDLTGLMEDYTGLGKTGETVIAEEMPDGDARFLGPTRFGEDTALSTVVPGEAGNVPINAALDRKAEILVHSVDYRGRPVLAATDYIDDPLLGLAVKIDKSEAYAPVNRLLAVFGGVLGLAVVLVLLVSLVLSRSITRPIVELTGVAEAISTGDLSRRAEAARNDEVGTLARAFNEMTDDLAAEREGLEQKVEERTAELARSNKELEGYAHTVSHDLKGPITSINLAGALLEDMLGEADLEDTRETMRELVDQIRGGTERSFNLIQDLLALAEAGREPSIVPEVDLNETVERIIVEQAQRAQERGARVVVEGDLGSVNANSTHVYQLFSNLVVNAIKHNDSPEPLIEIGMLGAAEGGGFRYAVRDNGPGISEEELPRIFEPFFKGKTGETGIGLATVRKIVETYGGSISARNLEGGGASFEFVLRDYPAEVEPG